MTGTMIAITVTIMPPMIFVFLTGFCLATAFLSCFVRFFVYTGSMHGLRCLGCTGITRIGNQKQSQSKQHEQTNMEP